MGYTPPDNPEAYRFAVDYRKLNALTKYPRYPLPLIDDLIMNIPHTGIMSALDLRSGYFQMAQKAFDVVKAAITKAPILKFPAFKKPFELFTDASSIGIEAVLNQEQRPVVFASRTLSAAEWNYTVTERECLAVVWALNKFRTYLVSLPIKVTTDHAALTHLTTGKNLSNKMIIWALKLTEFNIEWEHRPGTQNNIADVLSRNPIECIIGEKVNCAIIRYLVLSSGDKLIEEQKADPELGHIYRYLENPEDSSVNAAICENWSRDFRLVEASARVIADNFFDNYISRFGAPIKLKSDNGTQFISDIFENLSERLGIRHVKTVVYRPQANRTERVNRELMQMIATYVNEQHDTWDQFLREFAYAIRTTINETTGKSPAKLFLGRKLITPFQKLVMVSDGSEFTVGDIERLFEEARRNTKSKHEKWENYYNRRRHDVQIKVNDLVLVAIDPLSSATRKVVAKFKPKFEDQVRIYRHRKCDETEIGAGSSDNGSLRDESSGFDRVQRRSNESRDGKKKGSEVKRELEEKGLSFRNNQGEKHTNKTNKRRLPLIRSIPSSWSEKGRMIKKNKNESLGYKRSNEYRSGGPKRKVPKGSEHRVNKRSLSSNDSNGVLPRLRNKNRREETLMSSTSGYNLRPRKGKRDESRLTIERKTQKGRPVRSRKGRERNDSPYIKEGTRSSNKNARRGGDQQRQDQERTGTSTKKSLSLEVLVGNANYKS
ncbi:retrovirus-related Pol polyprotein from transposon opus [Trichonephila clavipes]|nr:retrovirus-related Pol polyprotein from transposon opus [Trichonephila clavipes]